MMQQTHVHIWVPQPCNKKTKPGRGGGGQPLDISKHLAHPYTAAPLPVWVINNLGRALDMCLDVG
jgi:hypothetical protein